MSPGLRKGMLTAHVVVSVGWLGVALTMVGLATRGLLLTDPEARTHNYEVMHFFDRALNAPLAVSMLVTSLICALFTRWGLVRHTWVLVKLVLSVTIFLAIPLLSAPRLITLTESIPLGTEPPGTAAEVLAVAVCGATTLVVITTVSVVKPWGRTRWY